MSNKFINMVFFLLCLASHSPARAESEKIIAASGSSKVNLLELYSSESCSSCPPADQWVSEFESDKELWHKFVPVVFHVDYWNYLSWKDEFSSSDMTARQVAISKTWSRPSVYTPAVILDGAEWPNWREAPLNGKLVNNGSKLTLIIVQNSAGLFRVKVTGLSPGAKYIVHLAKLGMGITSKITDGENSGKTLKHNFVILDWQNQNLGSAAETNFLKFAKSTQKAKKFAMVAWIEEVGRHKALQATGAYL